MIYHVVWLYMKPERVTAWNQSVYPDRKIGDMVCYRAIKLAEFIKSSEDDTFLFILAHGYGQQKEEFEEWLDRYKLRDLLVVKTKGITNPIHSTVKHGLMLAVLQSSNHFQREQQKEKTE